MSNNSEEIDYLKPIIGPLIRLDKTRIRFTMSKHFKLNFYICSIRQFCCSKAIPDSQHFIYFGRKNLEKTKPGW